VAAEAEPAEKAARTEVLAAADQLVVGGDTEAAEDERAEPAAATEEAAVWEDTLAVLAALLEAAASPSTP
jgi:hypothetical protein